MQKYRIFCELVPFRLKNHYYWVKSAGKTLILHDNLRLEVSSLIRARKALSTNYKNLSKNTIQ